MSRKKIEQDVYYKSFRYTSNVQHLNEFLNSLDNTNRFIISQIVSSKKYHTYIKNIEDEMSVILGGFSDGFE